MARWHRAGNMRTRRGQRDGGTGCRARFPAVRVRATRKLAAASDQHLGRCLPPPERLASPG